MSRLLVFNLATDADDPVLGFTTVWLNRLAAHYDALDVITMRAGRLDVAGNVRVYSVGKERGFSEPRRVWEFHRLLRERLAEQRYEACFAHMMPLFAVLGAPQLRIARVPVTLWYTHRSAHWTVRAAVPLVRRVVTAAPDSFPIATPKLRVLGHGVDTGFFSPADLTPQPPLHVERGSNEATQPHPPSPLSSLERGSDEARAAEGAEARHAVPLQIIPSDAREEAGDEGVGAKHAVPLQDAGMLDGGAQHAAPLQAAGGGDDRLRAVVHVARLMAIKHQATLIRAVAAVPETRAVFIGDVPPGQDAAYPGELAALAAELGAEGRVTFAGAQAAVGVRGAYRAAFAAVNLSPPGLFDKAALEAMACAVPTLVTNPAFDELLGGDVALLRTAGPDDAEGLASGLRALLALPTAERTGIGQRLREHTVAAHSLDGLIERLVSVLNTGEPA